MLKHCFRLFLTQRISLMQKPHRFIHFGHKRTHLTCSTYKPLHLITGNLFKMRNFSIYPALSVIKIVKTPNFPESISEGDVEWVKEIGDVVEEDDIVCNISTDKTAIAVHAPIKGKITKKHFEEADTVTASSDLFEMDDSVDNSSINPPTISERSQVEDVVKKENTQEQTPSPKIQIKSENLKILSQDNVKGMQMDLKKSKGNEIVKSAQQLPKVGREESVIKMSRMRRKIASRLKDAQNATAMLTTFNEVDMTKIMELRSKYKEDFIKKHGIKLGFMSIFAAASCHALRDQPIVNAFIQSDNVVYRNYVDISVAIAAPKGLVVPVIRNVESKSFAQIEKELLDYSQKAQKNGLDTGDMLGGTFTISNGGVFGSLMGTPIINMPQSAILGMHSIVDRPIAINKKVEVRPMMYLALTYDHRLIDGREAVLFLKKIKSVIEDPTVLLINI
ncbi:hypothetical protein A3Q56_00284 [Intoshia linei]|uniref:Dihydrolipoyllysine-residue succinyltransferase component of 2-oxoglutarate dehydrogenase complex, mitochondrial n=1 Tax=Intoshia linei TaxID=1819745 RepID=A0A177BC78_9BILA|nr:hypothetical protein A3Q56_00284 [Intoshia linei]